MALVLCTSSDNALYLLSFVKISQRVSKLLCGHHFHCEIFKGNYSVKNVGGVMVLFFFSLFSAHPLLYQGS